MESAFQLLRVCVVIALVIVAAVLSTPKGRIPLALRGVLKILRKDRGLVAASEGPQPVSTWKKLLAFLLVLLAFILAKS